MKTIEQKAKAYDEALEKARKLYEKGTITESIGYIFPELEKSEDEKIRKSLLKEFIHLQGKDYKFAGLKGEEIIAWLIKQGNKLQGKSAFEAIQEEKVDNSNKIKSKFKVSDWIVFNNGNVKRITSVGTHGYTFDDGDYLLYDECDKIAHLWSIEDAKDGDVLSNGRMVVIFKEFEEPSYTLLNDLKKLK